MSRGRLELRIVSAKYYGAVDICRCALYVQGSFCVVYCSRESRDDSYVFCPQSSYSTATYLGTFAYLVCNTCEQERNTNMLAVIVAACNRLIGCTSVLLRTYSDVRVKDEGR